MNIAISRWISGWLLYAFCLLGFAPAAIAQQADFTPQSIRVGLPLAGQTEDGAGCKAGSEVIDQNARDYVDMLAARFNTDVTLCLTETYADLAELAGREEVNFVWLDQERALPLLDSWRPMLTLREHTDLGRAPLVLFSASAANEVKSFADVNLADIGFLGRPPEALNIDLAKRLLSDYGVAGDYSAAPRRFATYADLMDAVETGEVRAGILEGGTWGRACGVLDPASTFCDHLNALIYDRPRAIEAFMIPLTTDKERHFRLIGVHIALHIENPDVFAWLSQSKGPEYEPTEADAMRPKSANTAIAF